MTDVTQYEPNPVLDPSVGFESYNNVERAIDLLPEQFKGKDKIEGFIETYAAGVQEVEDLLTDIFINSEVDTAIGQQLDILGDLFGEFRKGRNDRNYRLGLKARIATNTSNGTPNEILAILKILLGSERVSIFEHYPASFAVAGTIKNEEDTSRNSILKIPDGVQESMKAAAPIAVGDVVVLIYLDDNALLGELDVTSDQLEVSSDGTAYDLIDNEGDLILYQQIAAGSGVSGLGILSEVTPDTAGLTISLGVDDDWYVLTELGSDPLILISNNESVIVSGETGGVLAEILE